MHPVNWNLTKTSTKTILTLEFVKAMTTRCFLRRSSCPRQLLRSFKLCLQQLAKQAN